MKYNCNYVVIIACMVFAPEIAYGTQRSAWSHLQCDIKDKPFQYFRITIPKSGTHLLMKCIELMKAKDITSISHAQPAPSQERSPKKCVPISRETFFALQERPFKHRLEDKQYQPKASFHLAYTQDREKFTKQCSKVTLFMIRDPRDQLVSLTKWACAKSKHGTEEFNKMLLNFIDGKQRDEIYTVRMRRPTNFMWTFGIAEYYKLYMPWMAVDNVYTVHFENLVGAEGGGSRQAQEQEIRNIARHLNIGVSPIKTKAIADNLFGGTSTFSKGQIGSWKEYFTKEHKQAFKKTAGQLLIDLGYEKDMNW